MVIQTPDAVQKALSKLDDSDRGASRSIASGQERRPTGFDFRVIRDRAGGFV
jgi:hypothetical protein